MKIFNRQINLKKILIITLLLVLINSAQLFILHTIRTRGDVDFYRYDHHLIIFIYSAIAVISTITSWKVFARKNKENTLLKTIKSFLISCVLFVAVAMVIDCFFVFLVSNYEYVWYDRLTNTLMLMVIIHIYISSFTLAFLHFKESQKTTVILAQTEKEKATLQSQMLQKNLEPHFLFNNLSILSGLAKKHPEQIEDFIDDFSDVYRYYLKHGKKQSVELKDELSFLESYMNLMEKRFGKAYQIQNSITKVEGFIIPCSLQLCIENAIKHNKASEEHPLLILLSRANDSIIIKNRLNKVDFTLGTATGNDYLKRQYELNFNKEVVFTETNSEFIVKIPLIK